MFDFLEEKSGQVRGEGDEGADFNEGVLVRCSIKIGLALRERFSFALA